MGMTGSDSRRAVRLLVGLGFAAFFMGAYNAAAAQKPVPSAVMKVPPPYNGMWATTPKLCHDKDGVQKMQITGDRFYWYESHCVAHDVKMVEPRVWTMRMACVGDEGNKFQVRPRLLLPTPNKLIFADQPPVGTTKRESFVRCEAKKRRR